jgi:hypothetical protein
MVRFSSHLASQISLRCYSSNSESFLGTKLYLSKETQGWGRSRVSHHVAPVNYGARAACDVVCGRMPGQTDDHELLPDAFHAAVAKARELGWIV